MIFKFSFCFSNKTEGQLPELNALPCFRFVVVCVSHFLVKSFVVSPSLVGELVSYYSNNYSYT